MLGRLGAVVSIMSTSAVLAFAAPVGHIETAGAVSAAIAAPVSLSVKGDRLSGPVHRSARHVSSSLTSTAVGDTVSVVMRDRQGRTIYRSDGVAGVTAVSRNSDFSELPVAGRVEVAAREAPATSQAAPVHLGKIPVGCERAVSALTRSAAARVIGRCVT